MEKFEYKAKDNQGKTIKGIIEAKDEKQASKILREKSLLLISLRPQRKSLIGNIQGGIFQRVSLSDKVNFTRQLSTMMNAGLRVTEALEILEVQASPAMGRVIGEILREVEGGSNLASALEKYPEVFDRVYVALVRAGEMAGVLDKTLTRLADNLENQKEFQSKVKGALIYPAIVLLGMAAVMVIMILFVIPQMVVIYEEFEADLPIYTKILIAISKFATKFWWLGLFLAGGLIFGWRILNKNPQFRKQFDRILFKIPIIGPLNQKIMLTEFTRTLGLLAGTGVLIVDALQIARYSFKSPLFEEAINKASQEVEKGLPLATALARTEVFPPILPQMVAVGEETGKIDEVLAKVSAYFEQEAATAVKALTTAIEPIIMIVLGVGVGFLVFSVIMPIYNLLSQF